MLNHDVVDLILGYLDAHEHRCFAFVLRGCRALAHLVSATVLRPPYVCNYVCTCLLPTAAFRTYAERMIGAMLHDHVACVARVTDSRVPCPMDVLMAMVEAGKCRWIDVAIASMRVHCARARPWPHLMTIELLQAAIRAGVLLHMRDEFAVPRAAHPRYELQDGILTSMCRDDVAEFDFLLQYCNDSPPRPGHIAHLLRSIGAAKCLAHYGVDPSQSPIATPVVRMLSIGCVSLLSDAELRGVTRSVANDVMTAALRARCLVGVRTALAYGASAGVHAVNFALRNNMPNVVQTLIEHGAPMPLEPLSEATHGCALDSARYLVQHGYRWSERECTHAIQACRPPFVAYMFDSADALGQQLRCTARLAVWNHGVLRMLLAQGRARATVPLAKAAVQSGNVNALLALVEHGVPRSVSVMLAWIRHPRRGNCMLGALLSAGFPVPPRAGVLLMHAGTDARTVLELRQQHALLRAVGKET